MASVLLLNTMSQTNKNINNDDNNKPTTFHDFLGGECAPVTTTSAARDVSGGGSGSRAGPSVFVVSDAGLEKQVVSHLEGVPFYGHRSEHLAPEIGNRYAGVKRSNSDSVFVGSSRDGVGHMRPDFPDSSHLLKMLRNIGQEQPKRSNEPILGAAVDINASVWERAIPVNVGPVMQCPPHAGQAAPYAYQPLSNRFKDANVAADEGSRTGMKGSGMLSSVNVSGGMAEPSSGRQKSAISLPEPGSSTPHRRHGSTSASRQMTIFYGGQAHVFDDVHPNKAEAIMALAGSGGGSWSTNLSPTSSIKAPGGETIVASREPSNSGIPFRDIHGRSYVTGNSNDRMSLLPGSHSRVLMTDARQPTPSVAEPVTEEKL